MSFPCAPKPNAFQPGKAKTKNNLGDWLAQARRRLSTIGARGEEASILAAFALARERSWILAHPEAEVTGAQAAHLDSLLTRLAAGEPLPYLTGLQEFYGLSFQVTPQVLIPRPETEVMVEHSLRWLKEHPSRRRAVDVGTGSGCIAVSLAYHVPDLHIVACDLSSAALAVARANAARHGVAERVAFLQSDLLTSLSGRFDLVCANLPYMPGPDVEANPPNRHEPILALDGGEDGLGVLRRLSAQLPRYVNPSGLILLEIEYRQGSSVPALIRADMPKALISTYRDLAGLDRLVRIELPDEN